ncbi:14-3-3-like protein GF14-G isoform X2 [Phragmites australis]|uniref:14-3-3-like protein GF14-G isoform X2 n=1 Tax=Phragmites australis TaxID=29695 RepID=UPI002D788F91|nr:14-3-3-like protein GF14-G isoform X2 [Phragmites australis]
MGLEKTEVPDQSLKAYEGLARKLGFESIYQYASSVRSGNSTHLKYSASQKMMDAMNRVAMLDTQLTAEERNLLLVGYKKVTSAKRASLHVLASTELKEATKGNQGRVRITTEFRHKVEAELDRICNNVIETIDKHLLPFSSDAKSKVFYYQMKGDFYRYLAELKMGPEIFEVADQSLKAYETASKIAEENFSPADHIRLGLALNISVFYYEIMDSPDRACQVAKQAFDEAVVELESLNEDDYNDSTMILQILRNNLALWNSNMDIDADDAPEWTGKGGAPGNPPA